MVHPNHQVIKEKIEKIKIKIFCWTLSYANLVIAEFILYGDNSNCIFCRKIKLDVSASLTTKLFKSFAVAISLDT